MEFINGNRKDLEVRAAGLISDKMKSLDKVVLGIVGGSSVGGVFACLVEEDIDWSNIYVFMVDERFVPIGSNESNYRGAYEGFLGELIESGKLPQENVKPFRYDEDLEDGGVGLYGEELQSLSCKLGKAPQFDIIILSAGEDGHTGSLFPNHASIRSECELFIKVDDSPKPPPMRMSASRKLLERSDMGLLLFFGERKKEALGMFKDGSVSTEECPCKVVLEIGDAYVLSDIQLLPIVA